MNEKAFISFVFYLKDDFKNISKLLSNLKDYYLKFNGAYEIILVDDSSNEEYSKQVTDFAKKEGLNIILIRLAWDHGLERAMQSGVDLAIGDFIVEVDYPYIGITDELLSKLFDTSAKGFDVVSVVNKSGSNFSKLFYKILKRYSDLNFEVKSEVVRIVSRRVVNNSYSNSSPFYYRKIKYRSTGYPYKYILINEKGTQGPKQSILYRIKMAINLLFTFTNIPLIFSAVLSLLFMLVSISVAVYAISIYVMFETVVEGWTTTMLFLSFGLGGLFLIIALILKYLNMILTFHLHNSAYVPQYIKRMV